MNGDQQDAIAPSGSPESPSAEPAPNAAEPNPEPTVPEPLSVAEQAEKVLAGQDESTDTHDAAETEPNEAIFALAEPPPVTGEIVGDLEIYPPFYIRSQPGGPIRQGEILSNVLQHKINTESIGHPELTEVDQVIHVLAIVLSQDCDLEQDFTARQRLSEAGAFADPLDERLLPNILLCFLATEGSILATLPAGTTIRNRFWQNKEDRYQFLRGVEPNQDAQNAGIPGLGIDFRRYFTVPTDELYRQLDFSCVRRCRLAPQYLEHLSCRFANFLSRVGLPRNHRD